MLLPLTRGASQDAYAGVTSHNTTGGMVILGLRSSEVSCTTQFVPFLHNNKGMSCERGLLL